jgi:hypothetical protein
VVALPEAARDRLWVLALRWAQGRADSVVAAESIYQALVRSTQEYAGPGADGLTTGVASVVAACHFELCYLLGASKSADHALHRYLAAAKALAAVRRHPIGVVNVALGGPQLVQVGTMEPPLLPGQCDNLGDERACGRFLSHPHTLEGGPFEHTEIPQDEER